MSVNLVSFASALLWSGPASCQTATSSANNLSYAELNVVVSQCSTIAQFEAVINKIGGSNNLTLHLKYSLLCAIANNMNRFSIPVEDKIAFAVRFAKKGKEIFGDVRGGYAEGMLWLARTIITQTFALSFIPGQSVAESPCRTGSTGNLCSIHRNKAIDAYNTLAAMDPNNFGYLTFDERQALNAEPFEQQSYLYKVEGTNAQVSHFVFRQE